MQSSLQKPYFILIHGPTGVGKTDFALELARRLPRAHIVNADLGQCYTPLTIGTAKPNWHVESIPHHLFDIIDEPVNTTVVAYRNRVIALMQELWAQDIMPILVGGSGFYLKSLLFPPADATKPVDVDQSEKTRNTQDLWHKLAEIDQQRAAKLHPSDSYRIARALEIYENTGKRPSDAMPQYNPPACNYLIVHLTRDRADLYERINHRTVAMLESGWIEEVRRLQNTPWQSFLEKKKLIGYDTILSYLKSSQDEQHKKELIASIQQKTRNYAKRQETFWRMLRRAVEEEHARDAAAAMSIKSLNLTLSSVDLYIDELFHIPHLYQLR